MNSVIRRSNVAAVECESPNRIVYMITTDHEIGEVATTPPSDLATTMNNNYESTKRGLDLVLALIMLPIAAPLMLVFMFVVRLNSRGPVIYSQRRLGLAGKVFTIYKIRTMYQDSERRCGPIWSVPGDPRVTPVGRFLRWSHIDELPQLINVLKGEMSLVGPRPERPEFLAQLERALPNYRQRLTVRPGLTGLAQVQQDPDSDLSSVRRKLNFDLCYLERMSLWLDLRVMVGTVLKCLGVPFGLIGRILQLPDPNGRLVDESLLSQPELSAKSIVSDTCMP
jgi:lipopolysaccharide/colanic/teichoic acid biosynthesis glycosyltransferase